MSTCQADGEKGKQTSLGKKFDASKDNKIQPSFLLRKRQVIEGREH